MTELKPVASPKAKPSAAPAGLAPQVQKAAAAPSAWMKYVAALSELLGRVIATDEKGRALGNTQAFRAWHETTLRTGAQGGTTFLIGNGASASMASHIAADVAKGARLRTQVFTDLSLLTAVANDIDYEEVFATPLAWSMGAGDQLVAISSSGNSANIVRAIEVARERGGHVVTLSAMEEDNAIRNMGALNFYLPALTYGHAETTHAAILHYWVDHLLEARKL